MISNNIRMKENFLKTEENYVFKASKNAAIQNTDKTQENKNSNFPIILIDEEETIFIEVESN